MERRLAIAGAIVLLLSAVVVVQMLDPQFEERTPPEVDFSEPPNEVAADAAEQFEYVDYAYRVDVKYNGSDGWRQLVVTQVDHTQRAYRSVGPGGEDETVIYGTTTTAFVRPTAGEEWSVVGKPELVYPVKRLTQPIFVGRIRADKANIVSEGRSTVTIRVDVNPMKIEGGLPGNASIVVNKDTGMIESVHVAYEPPEMETRYLRLKVTEKGTNVARPEAIGLSLSEAFWDLLRGPLFRIDWLI